MEMLSPAAAKAKLIAEANHLLKTFLKTNLDDLSISLLVFPSRTNQKLHFHNFQDVFLFSKKQTITNFLSSQVSDPLYFSGGSTKL